MVNVQTEHLENHIARLTVEVDPDRIETAVRQAARQISRKARIPGFRPGKAPFNIVINVFGYDYVLSEALDTVGNDIYREALEASGVEPYAPGSLQEVRDQGKVLVFSVPKAPVVDLGDYRAIRAEDQPAEVTDEMVTNAMEDMRDSQALVEEVQRPAQMGDQVTFGHFEASVVMDDDEDEDDDDLDDDDEDEDEDDLDDDEDEDKDDDEDEDQDDEDDEDDEDNEETLLHRHDFSLVLHEDPARDLFPGLSAELVGAVAGDELDFYLQVPSDSAQTELAGKTLHVKAEITKVESRIVPEWSDELAQRISKGQHETILALRMATRRQLEETAQRESDERIAAKALDLLVEGATFQYPQELIEAEIDQLANQIDYELLRPQGITLDDFLRITGKTAEEFRADQRDNATVRAKRALAMAEFVRQEQIVATGADIDAEIEGIITGLGGEEHAGKFRQLFNSDQSRGSIGDRLVTNRAVKRLVAIARGENPPRGIDLAEPQPAPELAEAPVADAPQDTTPETVADPDTRNAE